MCVHQKSREHVLKENASTILRSNDRRQRLQRVRLLGTKFHDVISNTFLLQFITLFLMRGLRVLFLSHTHTQTHTQTHTHTHTPHTKTHAHTQFKDVVMSSTPKSFVAQAIHRLENFVSPIIGSGRKQTNQVVGCMVISDQLLVSSKQRSCYQQTTTLLLTNHQTNQVVVCLVICEE